MMQVKTINGNKFVVPQSRAVYWKNVQNAMDMMAEAAYQGASGIILNKSQLPAEFFDLKTGMAGEVLQKFSTYQMKLIILGDFKNIESKSLRDFIYESNKVGQIVFSASLDQ